MLQRRFEDFQQQMRQNQEVQIMQDRPRSSSRRSIFEKQSERGRSINEHNNSINNSLYQNNSRTSSNQKTNLMQTFNTRDSQNQSLQTQPMSFNFQEFITNKENIDMTNNTQKSFQFNRQQFYKQKPYKQQSVGCSQQSEIIQLINQVKEEKEIQKNMKQKNIQLQEQIQQGLQVNQKQKTQIQMLQNQIKQQQIVQKESEQKYLQQIDSLRNHIQQLSHQQYNSRQQQMNSIEQGIQQCKQKQKVFINDMNELVEPKYNVHNQIKQNIKQNYQIKQSMNEETILITEGSIFHDIGQKVGNQNDPNIRVNENVSVINITNLKQQMGQSGLMNSSFDYHYGRN